MCTIVEQIHNDRILQQSKSGHSSELEASNNEYLRVPSLVDTELNSGACQCMVQGINTQHVLDASCFPVGLMVHVTTRNKTATLLEYMSVLASNIYMCISIKGQHKY